MPEYRKWLANDRQVVTLRKASEAGKTLTQAAAEANLTYATAYFLAGKFQIRFRYERRGPLRSTVEPAAAAAAKDPTTINWAGVKASLRW